MNRILVEAWARREGVSLLELRPLRFEVPLLRWTLAESYAQRDVMLKLDPADRVRINLWLLTGQAWKQRGNPESRRSVRSCLRAARLAWVAHCAEERGTCGMILERLRASWLEIVSAPVTQAGVDAMLAAEKRRVTGKHAVARRWGKADTSRDDRIRRAAATGAEAADLADHYRLSKRRIQQIIKGAK